MEAGQIVTIVSVIVSPASALIAVWMTANLTARQRRYEQQEKARADALLGLSRFISLALDADPTLVSTGNLREYPSPKEAVAGLYKRWQAAREPLVLLAFSHPSAEVRNLALNVQAELEVVLRDTDDQISGGSSLPPIVTSRITHEGCLEKLSRLGQLLSSFPPGSVR